MLASPCRRYSSSIAASVSASSAMQHASMFCLVCSRVVAPMMTLPMYLIGRAGDVRVDGLVWMVWCAGGWVEGLVCVCAAQLEGWRRCFQANTPPDAKGRSHTPHPPARRRPRQRQLRRRQAPLGRERRVVPGGGDHAVGEVARLEPFDVFGGGWGCWRGEGGC
jgi:hypothetical protein